MPALAVRHRGVGDAVEQGVGVRVGREVALPDLGFGTLTGGDSYCWDPQAPDYYGRFS